MLDRLTHYEKRREYMGDRVDRFRIPCYGTIRTIYIPEYTECLSRRSWKVVRYSKAS